MENPSVDGAARIIWDYHRLDRKPQVSECLLVMGSHDPRVADHAADLFLDGWAPLVVCSGGVAHAADLLCTGWKETEAEHFARRMTARGVPEEAVFLEQEASNTGENVLFTDNLLKSAGYDIRRVLIVQKPYMERRAWATARAQCPHWDVTVTSPPLTYDEYPDETLNITGDAMIHIMVGDLIRIRDYPKQGFQIPQNIPPEVNSALQFLLESGYGGHAPGIGKGASP